MTVIPAKLLEGLDAQQRRTASSNLARILAYVSKLLKHGLFHLSTHTLATKLNMSRRTTWKWLKRLAVIGWLTVIAPGSYGAQMATIYSAGKHINMYKNTDVYLGQGEKDRGRLFYLENIKDKTPISNTALDYLKQIQADKPIVQRVSSSQRAGLNIIYWQWHNVHKIKRYERYQLDEYRAIHSYLDSPHFEQDYETAVEEYKQRLKEYQNRTQYMKEPKPPGYEFWLKSDALYNATRGLAPEVPTTFRPIPNPPQNIRPWCPNCYTRRTSVYVNPYQDYELEWRCDKCLDAGVLPFNIVFTVIDFASEVYEPTKDYFPQAIAEKEQKAHTPTEEEWETLREAIELGYSIECVKLKYPHMTDHELAQLTKDIVA